MGIDTFSHQKNRRAIWAWGLLLTVIAYTLIGFLLVPAIIKSQLLKRLPGFTKRAAYIREVKFNPYSLSLTIRGFSLTESTGQNFSSFDELYVNFQPWASLFQRSWVFDEIHLYKPFAQITYQSNGVFNFANLIPEKEANKPAASASSNPLPALTIRTLIISNGMVAFDDFKRLLPFQTQFQPIDLALTNLTTVPDRNSPYSFTARTGKGESFAWSGTISINPLGSAGIFKISGLQLAKYATYSHDYARFELVSGSLDVAAEYHYDSSTNALNLSLTNAAINLAQFALKTPDGKQLLVGLPNFSITNIDADLAANHFHLGLIKSTGGFISLEQNRDGTINLLSLLDLPKPAAEETNNNTTLMSAPLKADIGEIAFDDYTVLIKDSKPAQPAHFKIDQLNFDLKGVSNQTNAPVAFSLGLRLQEMGTIALGGTGTLLPPSADVQIGITNLDLRAIQPYLEDQIKLVVTSGTLDVTGHAQYMIGTNKPLLQFAGDAVVKHFTTTDDVMFKDFAKWESLTISGIQFQMQPDKLQVNEVKFSGLDTSLIIGPDRQANLQTILRNQIKTNAPGATNLIAASPAQKNNETNAPLFPFSLDKLSFENGSVHFADQSIQPNCAFDVMEFSGAIEHLSSTANQNAAVNLQGKVDSHSPFAVNGTLNPLGTNLFADITIWFTNTDLTAFTPYTEKFAGRPLQKGKVSFAVHYRIDQKKLKAENGFFVDQLTLGPKNGSLDATSLPVKLAVALLKDRKGRIEINAPLAGRIDDPTFKVFPLIRQVIINLLTKAAASPFSMLGSMFGGGEELSFVAFAPGQTAIPESETNKLETLAKALFERPELTLEINGSVNAQAERPILAQRKLEEKIRAACVKQLAANGGALTNNDLVELSAANREKIVRELYEKTFGKYQPGDLATNLPVPAISNRAPVATVHHRKTISILSGQVLHPESAEPVPGSLASAKLSVPLPPERGATLLFAPAKNRDKTTPQISRNASEKTNGASAQMVQASRPLDLPLNELVDMETQLLEKTEVTDNDLREVMKARAAEVQTYLIKTGKVAADRLYIISPKSLGTGPGEDRVNLALD